MTLTFGDILTWLKNTYIRQRELQEEKAKIEAKIMGGIWNKNKLKEIDKELLQIATGLDDIQRSINHSGA